MPAGVDAEAAQETVEQVTEIFKNFSLERLATLVLLFAVCVVVIHLVMSLVGKTMARVHLDRGVQTFLSSGLKVLLWLVAVCVLLGYLGVPMTSLVAVLGVLGLAISLAVQGTLSNLAGGIMLLVARPFTVGDFVEAGGVSGTVAEVGLAYTKLNTVDNKVVFVPNGDISGTTIINYTAEERRQVELKFSVSYDAPVERVKACISQVIGEHPKTIPDPEPLIRVCAYGESAVEYLVRCWCATEDYWEVYFDLNEQVKARFDRAGVEMTYPHMNVHLLSDREKR